MKIITIRKTTIILTTISLLVGATLLTSLNKMSFLLNPSLSAAEQHPASANLPPKELAGTWLLTILPDGFPPEAATKWICTLNAGGGWIARSSSLIHPLSFVPNTPKLIMGGFSGNWWSVPGKSAIAEFFGAQFLFLEEDQSLFGYDTLRVLGMKYDATGALSNRWEYNTYDVAGNQLLTLAGSTSWVRLTEASLMQP